MNRCILFLFAMIYFMHNDHAGCAQEAPGPGDRKAAVAGRFYPGTGTELRSTLQSLFAKAKPRAHDNVRALIAPHAGYVFSGEVAASGYNQVDPGKTYDNVFLIASSHQHHFDGASVYTEGDYITPLGRVKVNKTIAGQLIRDSRFFSYHPQADRTEHSTEVHVPFLQYHLKPGFMLIPIVVGTQSEQTCRQIARALKPYFTEKNLFVISTDFSHYPSYTDAVEADQLTCEAIVAGSPEDLTRFLENYKKKEIPNLSTNLCSWTSVLTLLEIVRETEGLSISPVQYKNSGDSPYGDKAGVVGYWSLVVSGQSTPFSFTTEEQKKLLSLARKTLEQYLGGKGFPEVNKQDYSGKLAMHAGAFVSLKKRGELRGCIGSFHGDIPLYEVVGKMAVASATQDSRFSPVTLKELSTLEIEISVLSPMKKIQSTNEIIPGKHGIYIKKGYASGTFLPQVATETGWNTTEFLGHCSRDKAGIGWDGWKDAEIYTYEAAVFGEKEFNGRK